MTECERQDLLQRYLCEPTIENRNTLVAAYQYLCARGARKFFRGTLDRADLVQVAVIGLIKAADRYQAGFGTPFEAYAWLMVVGELMHYVRDYEELVRIPRWMRSLDKRYREAHSVLWECNAREPTVVEIAAHMGTSVEVVDELRGPRGSAARASLEESISRPGASAAVVVAERGAVSIEDRLALEVAIAELLVRERVVVTGIFVHGLTQRELGERLGVSQRHVSRILNAAMKKIAFALR
jgi:RNA polymerase sigma-B factor